MSATARALVLFTAVLVAAAPVQGADSRDAAVDALFAAYDQSGSPGFAVGVYSKGRTVVLRGYGYADLEQNTRITPQTVFHVASVSKQFTGLAIALLARDGKLSLDADVRSFLPQVPDFGTRITVANLLHHTSGLRDQWSLFDLGGHPGLKRQQQILNMVERQRALNFQPGTEYSYCNTGYTLLAEVVRAASGKSLRAFTGERIFRPLGMAHSFFFDDVTELVPARANSYVPGNAPGSWKRALLTYENVGATSLHTTVEDLMHWAGNFSRPRVGDAALVRQLSEPGKLVDGSANRYGFGLYRQEYAGHDAVMHTGSDAGFRSVFAYFPREDFAVALLSNASASVYPLLESITHLYLDGGKSPPATAMPREIHASIPRLQEMAGEYLRDQEKRVTLSVADGKLTWNTVGGTPWPLFFRENGTADPGDYLYDYYRFTRDASGRVTGFDSIDAAGTEPPRHYQRVPPFDASKVELGELTGDYRLEELDQTYRFSVDNGSLVARSLWNVEPIVFVPVARDRFDSSHWTMGTLVVRRNAQGRAVGFLIHAGRVRNVTLDRVTAP